MASNGVGPSSSKICILSGEAPAGATLLNSEPFYGWGKQFLQHALLRAGIHPDNVYFHVIGFHRGKPTTEELVHTINKLNSMPDLELIVAMGPEALKLVTGKTSLQKWHLSPLDTLLNINAPKAIGTFDPSQVSKDMSLQLYVHKTMERVKEGLAFNGPWKRKPYNFLINPDFEITMDVLSDLHKQTVLANDIETGAGIINTVGFAWSTSDAIAINTLPERLSDDKFHALWKAIGDILEDRHIGKIYQNNIFESMHYSNYGIRCRGYYHDTMWAQRLLYPEHKIGLDNVGRLFTHESYWKDIGKDYKDEGGKRDWSNVKDWPAHYRYNCLDTTGTYEAGFSQRTELEERGCLDFFDNYLMKLAEPIVEMCNRGLPVNGTTKAKLKDQVSAEITLLKSQLSEDINTNSPKQKAKFLKAKGYTLHKVRVSGNTFRETTNELGIKKLRLKHPHDKDLQLLLKLAHLHKALSSYINFEYHDDGKLRFMMNGVGTETLRFSSSKDPWDKGLNVQTLPSRYKVLFDAAPGHTWIQIDLKQAESRFVAYDSCDEKLIEMLEDETKDIHKFVAANIFGKAEDAVTKAERQLGKKSGHGANYAMGSTTFMDSCLKEMDLVLTRKESDHVLATYHALFPGIRRWHGEIRDTLYNTKQLSNPLGFTRRFYGRMDDNTFREAYAFKPQSTIPMINNHLMLHLLKLRDINQLDFDLHLQVHDSIVLMCRDLPEVHGEIAKACYDLDGWHPTIVLPAGQLRIPTSIEIGNNLGQLKDYQQ